MRSASLMSPSSASTSTVALAHPLFQSDYTNFGVQRQDKDIFGCPLANAIPSLPGNTSEASS